MLRSLRTLLGRRRSFRDWTVGGLAVLAFGLAAWAFFRGEVEGRPFALSITGCNRFELRHQIAGMLKEEAGRHGITLVIRAAAGSEEALRWVDSGALDLALVQGGLHPAGLHHVRQVAALMVEPLHLLVKPEIFGKGGDSPADRSERLQELKGKTINIGPATGGTHWMSLEALRFIGLEPDTATTPGDCRIEIRGPAELERIDDPEDLPDAVFLTSALPSRVAKHLVTTHGYRLVGLPFAEAFALDAFNDPEGGGSGFVVDKMHVHDAIIPAFTYQVDPVPVPPEPVHTLGARMLLVARDDVDPGAIAGLLGVILETRFARVAKPGLGIDLLDLPPELPLHDGTRAFLRRSKPLIAGDLLDLLDKAATIGAPAIGGALFVWQWYRQRTRRRRDEGFEHYIGRVTEIERRALQLEMDALLELRELLRLQHDLGHLKAEALARFVDGELAGEDLMSGFLAQVNDARNYLARLILHERDNLEEEAKEQGRPLKALWNEATAGLASSDSTDDHQNSQAPVEST